jgi:hypothetical protein
VRPLACVALVSSLFAGRAQAQSVDAGAAEVDAAASAVADAAPAAPEAAAAADVTPAPPAPAPAPVVLAPPPPLPAPPAAPASASGPGDEEAKADFQRTRPVPDGSPLRASGPKGTAALYGFAELDFLRDSTQSFGDLAGNTTLERPHTPFGDNGRALSTWCSSRLGGRMATPDDQTVQGLALVELGPSLDGGDLCQGSRVRHLYLAMRSPVLDLLVGRYYGLLGWGGKGFLPNTAAIVAPPGQLYHLEDQIRIAHIFRWRPIDVEISGAVGRFAPSSPQLELGARLAVNGWRGASAQGAGPPTAAPLQIGLSWAGREVRENAFTAVPSEQVSTTGHVWALDLFAPIIPARGDDLSNGVSLTLEVTSGDGFADWYPKLTGGVLFPALPNPQGRMDPTNPPPVYFVNVPPWIARFDVDGNLTLIEWHTLVLGAQYHLPWHEGRRIWVSGVVSRTRSNNAVIGTPQAGVPSVWDNACYVDLNAFLAITNALQLAFSFQETRQTFGDAVMARNDRSQLSVAYFF